MRVLVIDDDQVVLTHLQIFAQRSDVDFCGVRSLEDANKVLDERFFDIILIDANLNGSKVADTDLRAISSRCDSLVVISADFDPLPGWRFLQKPFSLDEFQKLLRDLKKDKVSV